MTCTHYIIIHTHTYAINIEYIYTYLYSLVLHPRARKDIWFSFFFPLSSYILLPPDRFCSPPPKSNSAFCTQYNNIKSYISNVHFEFHGVPNLFAAVLRPLQYTI